MSPAPVMMNAPQSLQVQTLAKSFEALLVTAHQLSCKEKALQQRLKYAHNEVNIFFFLCFLFLFPAPFIPLTVSNDEKKISSRSGVTFCDGDGNSHVLSERHPSILLPCYSGYVRGPHANCPSIRNSQTNCPMGPTPVPRPLRKKSSFALLMLYHHPSNRSKLPM